MKIVSGRNYEARLSPLVEIIAFGYGSQSLEILPKVLWAGIIAEFYETGEYGVTRKFWRAYFRLRNPISPDVVLVMKALFSVLDPQSRVETNTCFVFAHNFVLSARYLLFFFSLLTYITDSKNFLRCLLLTDGRSQLQHSDTSTKSVKRRMLKHRKWRGKINVTID